MITAKQKPDKVKKFNCDRCKDTGLYDACCRPQLCSCEAAARHKKSSPSWQTAYPQF